MSREYGPINTTMSESIAVHWDRSVQREGNIELRPDSRRVVLCLCGLEGSGYGDDSCPAMVERRRKGSCPRHLWECEVC